MKLNPYLVPPTTFNSKWIKELNIIPVTTKLLEENRGKLLDIVLDNFLDMTSKAQATKAKVVSCTTLN